MMESLGFWEKILKTLLKEPLEGIEQDSNTMNGGNLEGSFRQIGFSKFLLATLNKWENNRLREACSSEPGGREIELEPRL